MVTVKVNQTCVWKQQVNINSYFVVLKKKAYDKQQKTLNVDIVLVQTLKFIDINIWLKYNPN